MQHQETGIFMAAAIAQAKKGSAGAFPSAVLGRKGEIAGRGHNRRIQKGSATLQGENRTFPDEEAWLA